MTILQNVRIFTVTRQDMLMISIQQKNKTKQNKTKQKQKQKQQTNKQTKKQTKKKKTLFWSFRPNEWPNSLEQFKGKKIKSVKSVKQFRNQYKQNLILNYD